MKLFLAIFRCAENSKAHIAWKQLDPKTQRERVQKGMAANEQWQAKYKDQIVYDGFPLGEVTKRVDNQGVRDLPSQMGNFVVIQANSFDEATKMFLDHPHFALLPGDAVELLEHTNIPRG